MSKFKIGDRVKYFGSRQDLVNEMGTVAEESNRGMIGIRFDKKSVYLHTLSGNCDEHHGWYCFESELKFIKKTQPIVIYRKDQEVIALNKNTGEKAIAKCHPDDEFNFNTGAKLAFERLLGEETNVDKPDEIKIGDIVKVKHVGGTYTTYDNWSGLIRNGFDYRTSMIQCKSPDTQKHYTVVNKKEHDLYKERMLLLIRDENTGQVFIINECGVEKI